MNDFLAYIDSRDIEELKEELKDLYTSFESVQNYYQIKFKKGVIDQNLLSKYKDQVTKAIYFDEYMQGDLDIDKAIGIIERLNTQVTVKYYIEVSLHAVEECTNIANEYGGDFGEDFFIYFEEVFQSAVTAILKEGFEEEYKIRLKEMVDSAFDGYGHYDQLQDVLSADIRFRD